MQFRSVAAFVAVAFIAIAQASPVPVANAEAVAVPETVQATDKAPSPVVERGCRFWCY